MQTSPYLFVYGTLKEGFDNEFAQLLHANSRFVGNGFFQGNLYDLGEYPGAKLNRKTGGKVLGQVWELKDPAGIFPQLDYYEGIGPAYAEPTEYRRALVPVQLEGDLILNSWVYLYNWKATGRRKVLSGNYSEYLQQKAPPKAKRRAASE